MSENELLKMPIGKNSKIEAKSYLSAAEKQELKLKYIEFYRKDRIKAIKIGILSLVLTGGIITTLVYAITALI